MKVWIEEAARRSGNCERAKHVRRDADIVAQYERWARYAAIAIGLAFGLMLFVGIMAG
jgi:hypothetical protein